MNNISQQSHSTASSSYVAHYHMTREPFADTIEDDLYYAEPGRQQKLDILLHLTQYGNELVLVSGPTGSGKTTLLQQYLLKAMDTWSVARIDAQDGIDERKLMQQLFHQMEMDFQGATHSELFEHMQHHFDALQHSARQAVLLIDNAEHLPVTALKRVLEMAALTSADNKPLLRVILLGNDTLHENFDDPLLAAFDHLVRRSIELLPFDQEQTAHYIFHRLSAANFSADKPFTDAVLHKLHKQSQGWPASINQLAHNVLIETLPAPGSAQGKPSNIKVLRMVGALTGIALVGALIIFQDEFNAWLKPAPQNETTQAAQPSATLTQNAQESPTPTAKPSTAEPATTTLPLEIPAQEIQQKPPHEPDAQAATQQRNIAPAPALVKTSSETISETQAAPMATKAPETVNAPAKASKPAMDKNTAKATKVAANTTKTTPAKKLTARKPTASTTSIPADLPGFRAAWINAQNPNHYTLQLVAGNDLNTLRRFIRRHSPAEPLAIYHSTRKGKPWYGLVQQSYTSKQAAIDARSRLPEPLRQQTPWVRPFSSLQKDLQTAP